MARKPKHKSLNSAWIFCEGETEFNYFAQFGAEERIKGLQIRPKKSEDKNIVGLIEYSFNYLRHHKKDFLKGDLIFYVFDRDRNTNEDFKKAKEIVEHPDTQLILSNPCFEFWIVSHYELLYDPMYSELLKKKLLKHLGSYKKSDKDIYNSTREYIENAIVNSKKVYQKHLKNKGILCEESNPLTMMFQLIEILRRYKD